MASSIAFVFPFKVAAGQGRGAGAALGLMLFSALMFTPWACMRWGQVSPPKRAATLSLSWKLATAAAFGNVAQGYAFELLHAGVATTFVQLNVLFVTVLAVVWLKEALTKSLVLGVVLAVLGVGVTQWPALTGHLQWSLGVLWGVGAGLGFSFLDLLSRRHALEIDHLAANVLRAYGGALLLSLVPGAVDELLSMTVGEACACATAAFLGPGMGRLLLMKASRELAAAETALLQQLRSPLALPLTSLAFGLWPTAFEWAGSTLVIAAVAIPLVLAVFQYHRQ